MVNKTFELIIDTKRPMSNREFEVVEGDTGNVIVVDLFDNGEAVDLSECSHVIAVFANSKAVVYQSSNDSEGGVEVCADGITNRIKISLHKESFTVGITECELQVFSSSSVMITTARFNFNSRSAIYGDSAVSSSAQYPLLVELLNRTDTAVRDCEIAKQKADEAAEYAGGFDIRIGSVETVPSNQPVSVTNSGTGNKIVLNFKIPRGEAGAESYCLSSVMTNYGSGNLELALFRNGELCSDTVYVGIKKKAIGSSEWVNDSIVMRNGTAIYPYTNTVAIVATAFSDSGRTKVVASSSATCGAVGGISNIYYGKTAPVADSKYATGDIYFQYGSD